MRRDLLALTCAAATLVAGASLAQDTHGYGQGGSCKKAPPGSGEQLCIDDGTEASRQAREATRAASDQSSLATAPAATPSSAGSGFTASTTTTDSTWSSDQSASAASTPTTAPVSATVTTELVASAPVPDTPANRARYGQPLSHAGKMTAARGN